MMVKACNPSIQKVQHENRRECSVSLDHMARLSQKTVFFFPLFLLVLTVRAGYKAKGEDKSLSGTFLLWNSSHARVLCYFFLINLCSFYLNKKF